MGQYPFVSLAHARKEARRLLREEFTASERITFDAAYEKFKISLTSRKSRTQYDYKRVIE